MVKVTYHLTKEQLKKLREESEKTGLPVAEIIRRAVDRYFEKKQDKN